MNTLKNRISDYRLGLLKTPNIQVVNEKLSDETSKFPGGLMADLTFSWSTFKNSELINIEFIHVNFESSYFEKCLIKNCVFKNVIMTEGEVENCVFENCEFIDCNLSSWDVEKTTFNECKFFRSSLNKSVFELCHFRSPIFEGVEDGLFIALVMINAKFSNSKKSIKFEETVSFNQIFDQINKLD